MNAALGNVGQTVVYTDPLSPSDKAQIDQLRELITDIDAGRVKMLVILGGNPVYNTPADLKLNAERMDKVPLRVHLGTHFDETAELCHWHVSGKHYLECWSDARAYDGTATVIQPLIDPLYDSKNAHEVVQLFFKENFDKKDYDIVKAYWQTQNMTAFDSCSSDRCSGADTRREQVTAAAMLSRIAAKPAAQPRSNRFRGQRTGGNHPTPVNGKRPRQPATAPQRAAAASRSFEDNWRKAVHDGFVPNTALPRKDDDRERGISFAADAARAGKRPARDRDPSRPVHLRRPFLNNGWLQELPNPLTKITWENVALVSPAYRAKARDQSG